MHNTVLPDIWWNMLIKFSKQIGNSFAKIVNAKMSSIPCQTSEMELSRKSLLASEANSETCQTSKMESFRKIVKNEKPFTILQKPPSWTFDKVLNMLLNWLP